MFKTKKKELIICIITIVALLFTIRTTFAADTINELNNTGVNNTNIYNTMPNNTPVNNNTNKNTNTNTNKNTKTNNTNTTLPQTGIDSSMVFIIAICGISAIYAYKKIRDYNI